MKIRYVFAREFLLIRLIVAALVLAGAQMIAGAQAPTAVQSSDVQREATIQAPTGKPLPADLADPWNPSSVRAFGWTLTSARQIADRVRYITCDQESERSSHDRSHVALHALARLNYCSSIALVQAGSISHLATSVPPPARSN